MLDELVEFGFSLRRQLNRSANKLVDTLELLFNDLYYFSIFLKIFWTSPVFLAMLFSISLANLGNLRTYDITRNEK